MFVATIRTEYRFVPVSPVLRFTGVSDLDEYRESLQNPSCTVVHYVQPAGELDGASAEAPELVDLTVDGVPRPIRRMARTRAQVYAASIGDVAMRGDRSVAIAYTHRLLVQQHGHLLHLDISRPTKRLRVQFAHGGSGIRYVSVLDYIAGSTQARLSRLPASEPTPNIALGFDGWVFPRRVSATRRVVRGMQPVKAYGRTSPSTAEMPAKLRRGLIAAGFQASRPGQPATRK
jgi:hypothetical protein